MPSISLPKGYQRLGNFPLDDTFVFATKADLDSYASTNPTAYTGQICSVAATGLAYVILADKSVSQIGSSGAVGAHSHAIADVTGLETALNEKASLGVDGKVPASQLPSFVDDILEFANLAAFPATGETGKLYLALDTGKAYRWSGSAYVEIVAAPGSTDAVPEGTTNKYYTDARASAAAPVQKVAGRTGDVVLGISDVTDLQTNLDGKQIKTVYADTAPAHAAGLEWVDTNELRAYRSYNSQWVEIDRV